MAAGDRIGDVYLRGDKSRCNAYWRAADGTPEVFLCSIGRSVYNRHPHLRELFTELATEVAINHKRAAGSGVMMRAREPMPKSLCYPFGLVMSASLKDLPCAHCTRPQADDVHHLFGQGALDDQAANWTPGGLPIACCRVRVIGVGLAGAATTTSSTR
jgi:hypothetical protein